MIIKPYYFLLFIFLFSICSCNNSTNIDKTKSKKPNNKTDSSETLYYKVFKIDSAWGYDIYINGKRKIHQQYIPAVQGIQYFSSKKKAQITAKFVCEKLIINGFPPSVTVEELDSLKVLN